jgi:hypothetical protein
MRFSQRIGARAAPSSGLEEASKGLRTAIWNVVYPSIFPLDSYRKNDESRNTRSIWNHIGWRTDEMYSDSYRNREKLSEYWFSCEWPEFFDLLEHVASLLVSYSTSDNVYEVLNQILESQGCAYRFIARQLAPLTNPTEVGEVEAAAESAIPAVATHIRDSIRFLPPNAETSPRNSIKESISAVEAALKNLSGDASATFKEGLDAFEAKYGVLHPALRGGLLKLYGYTSDENGVRHALMDESADVTLSDARFMLVVCSAFANYLVSLSSD